jgi:hypothetical protein
MRRVSIGVGQTALSQPHATISARTASTRSSHYEVHWDKSEQRVTPWWFEGNYRDYEADLQRRNPELAENPHRIKYKALVRQ